MPPRALRPPLAPPPAPPLVRVQAWAFSAPETRAFWLGRQPASLGVTHCQMSGEYWPERGAMHRQRPPVCALPARSYSVHRCAAGGVQGWWKGLWSAHGPAVEQKFQGAVKAVSKAKLAMPGALCQARCRCGTTGPLAYHQLAHARVADAHDCFLPAPRCSGCEGRLPAAHHRHDTAVLPVGVGAAAAAGAAGGLAIQESLLAVPLTC